MKIKLVFLIVLTMSLATFCGTSFANLLPNPSMGIDEDPADGTPDGWWTWGADISYGGDSTQEFLMDSLEARTGDWYGHARAGAHRDTARRHRHHVA